jgi:hypothetical protein
MTKDKNVYKMTNYSVKSRHLGTRTIKNTQKVPEVDYMNPTLTTGKPKKMITNPVNSARKT